MTIELLDEGEFAGKMSGRSDSFQGKFRYFSEVSDPRIFGRDSSNPYYDLLYHVALEGRHCAQGNTSHEHASARQVVGQDTNIHPSVWSNILPEDFFIVELGTCTGGSTSHFAAGTTGKVISVDIESRPDTIERLKSFGNIELIVGNTRDPSLAWQISKRGPIDILFIDTDHNAEQVIIELSLYGPLVRPGGIILFDDIRINDGMSQWWDSLNEDKLELPEMHHTGFGVFFR